MSPRRKTLVKLCVAATLFSLLLGADYFLFSASVLLMVVLI